MPGSESSRRGAAPHDRRPLAGARALVVARPGAATTVLLARLRAHGLRVAWVRDEEEAQEALESTTWDVLIAPFLPGAGAGRGLMRRARARRPAPCVVLTAAGRRAAAAAVREGAYDVLPQPVDPERAVAVIRRGLEHRRLVARVADLERGLATFGGADPLAGHSRAISRAVEQVRRLADSPAEVLVVGEAGTGRSGVARLLHRLGPRRDGPFVAVSCEQHSGEGLERELFGVEEGDAGAIERAEGGTLFLGEIAAAPQAVQVRLLRVLEERAFERVGAGRTRHADARIVAATGEDLDARVGEGRFRGDLFRRLSAARIALPPLRERAEDIPALVDQFLRLANRRHRRGVRSVTRGVLERLQRHPWPGNLRELEDVLERMLVAAPGGRPLGLADLPSHLWEEETEAEAPVLTPGMTVEEAERELIALTLAHAGHDKPRAAAMLGIGVRTLYRKIRQYGLRGPGRR